MRRRQWDTILYELAEDQTTDRSLLALSDAGMPREIQKCSRISISPYTCSNSWIVILAFAIS
jgi:hypothetical protein